MHLKCIAMCLVFLLVYIWIVAHILLGSAAATSTAAADMEKQLEEFLEKTAQAASTASLDKVEALAANGSSHSDSEHSHGDSGSESDGSDHSGHDHSGHSSHSRSPSVDKKPTGESVASFSSHSHPHFFTPVIMCEYSLWCSCSWRLTSWYNQFLLYLRIKVIFVPLEFYQIQNAM